MVSANLIGTLVLNAINAVVILSLVALGLGVIFGLMGVINTAHGAMLTLGAYTVWLVNTEFGINFWIAILVAPLVGAAVGIVVEQFVARPLYSRLIDSILGTWGVALVIQQTIQILFGNTTKAVTNPIPGRLNFLGITYPWYRLFFIVVGTTVVASTLYLIYRTQFGIRLRAVVQDEDNAEMLGINRIRMYRFGFALGAGIAALAGGLIAPFLAVTPVMGLNFLIESFFAIILGGSGTLLGIIPGALVVGGVTNSMTFFLQPIVAQTLIYALIIGLIVLRPDGIMGVINKS